MFLLQGQLCSGEAADTELLESKMHMDVNSSSLETVVLTVRFQTSSSSWNPQTAESPSPQKLWGWGQPSEFSQVPRAVVCKVGFKRLLWVAH